MSSVKIAITLDQELLERIDRLVEERMFPSRSRAIQLAVKAQIDRIDRRRLTRECAKLDPAYEQQVARAPPTISNHGPSTKGRRALGEPRPDAGS